MGEFTTEAEEVIEREVKPTGNGAHVYVPKAWSDRSVRVVLLPEEKEECDICGQLRTNCKEWVWMDDSGGAWFNICGECRNQIDRFVDEDVCPLCGSSSPEQSKSGGFQPIGVDAEVYHGCDDCRTRVLFGNTEQLTPVWLKE